MTQWQNGDIPKLVEAFPDVTRWLTVVDGSLNGNGKGGALTNCDVAKWLWITAVADHVQPASDGGPTEMHNLITACGGCNYGKGAKAALDAFDSGVLGMTKRDG